MNLCITHLAQQQHSFAPCRSMRARALRHPSRAAIVSAALEGRHFKRNNKSSSNPVQMQSSCIWHPFARGRVRQLYRPRMLDRASVGQTRALHGGGSRAVGTLGRRAKSRACLRWSGMLMALTMSEREAASGMAFEDQCAPGIPFRTRAGRRGVLSAQCMQQ